MAGERDHGETARAEFLPARQGSQCRDVSRSQGRRRWIRQEVSLRTRTRHAHSASSSRRPTRRTATARSEPATVRSEPAAVRSEPATVCSEPAAVCSEPTAVRSEPTTTRSGATVMEPGAATKWPDSRAPWHRIPVRSASTSRHPPLTRLRCDDHITSKFWRIRLQRNLRKRKRSMRANLTT